MKKLTLYGVVALSVFALSACESKPKQPRVWKMELIGLQYDAYSGKGECAYKPARTDYYAAGYVTAFLPQGETICPKYATYSPDTEQFQFNRNY